MSEVDNIKRIRMIFILGKGRSGTTLLQNLLNAHPSIVAPPESKFVLIFYPVFGHIKKWTEKDILHFVSLLYTEPLFSNVWRVDRKTLTEKLLAIKEVATYDLVCKMVYYQMRKTKENVIYISDKNPQYVLFIDTLLKVFPDAKFIHIVRESRDNIYSHLKSFNAKNTIFRSYQWVSFNKIIEQHKKRMPERCFSVIYENLVSNTEKVMKDVCTFLNLPFVPEMAVNEPPERLINKSLEGEYATNARVIHKELLKPINTSNIGKWKSGLSEFDKTAVEIITADFARQSYGYDIKLNPEDKSKVSAYRLLKGKLLYYTWQRFTKLRYKTYMGNLFYSRLKRFIKGDDKVPIWERL